MKRFVFEFTNEENDRATEEFYLLKNVETAKSDCKTLCCVFAMMPLLLVFLYIIDSVREEDLKVILGLCVVVIIVGAATIFRLMYFGGAVPLGEIYNKEVRPSEEFQKSKKQLIFEVLQTKVNSRNEKSPAKFARLKEGITKQTGEKTHRQPG